MPPDFLSFYAALYHGTRQAFPWQQRLATALCAGNWPETLALPTSCGKTSLLEIHLYALALQAGLSVLERTAPLRLVYVVDRRLVVDEVAQHAAFLHSRLFEALQGNCQEDAPVREIAARLASFGGEGPLQIVELRGGMYRDESWIFSPATPLLCISTVDQAGSRLLFRGYGLSDSQLPVHAGFLGSDVLYCVDEGHLSREFLRTLADVRRYQGQAAVQVTPPLRVLQMTATPQHASTSLEPIAFSLNQEDLDHPVLGRRLQARKRALLVETNTLVQEVVGQAWKLAGKEHVEVVGVVLNRVKTARDVFRLLQKEGDADVILLTGRMRPWNRERLLKRWLKELEAGKRARGTRLRPLFVVATQAIEVGANLDFDAMVTQSASLSSLIQRLGRLNRLGEFPGDCLAVIVHEKQKKGSLDPIYGLSLPQAWDWLRQAERERLGHGGILDLGIAGLQLLDSLLERPQEAPLSPSPLLLPGHLDLWSQTSPRPMPDPDVAPFLHGLQALEAADVLLVWRADVTPDDPDGSLAAVAVAPPVVEEALPLPVAMVRTWLAGQANAADVVDVEGVVARSNLKQTQRPHSRGLQKVLRWRGPGESTFVNPSGIAPGDTLVLPAIRGGCDEFGWDPSFRKPVEDVGDACWNERARREVEAGAPHPRRARLRVHPRLFSAMREGGRGKIEALQQQLELGTPAVEAVAGFLNTLRNILPQTEAMDLLLTHMLNADQACLRFYAVAGEAGVCFLGQEVQGKNATPGVIASIGMHSDQEEADQFLTPPPAGEAPAITIEDHGRKVAALAGNLARRCGLQESLVLTESVAGRHHDDGKAHPGFQVLLHGGDEMAALAAEQPLAKSLWSRAIAEYAHPTEVAGLPRGFRHEFLSAVLLASHPDFPFDAVEADLLLHLVGSHHGRGRPFPPVHVEDMPEVVTVEIEGTCLTTSSDHGLGRLDSGWADRFWRLQRRFGPWGLAYLEALVRMADRIQSRGEV